MRYNITAQLELINYNVNVDTEDQSEAEKQVEMYIHDVGTIPESHDDGLIHIISLKVTPSIVQDDE